MSKVLAGLSACWLLYSRGNKSEKVGMRAGRRVECSTSRVEPACDRTNDVVGQQGKGVVVVPCACSNDAFAHHGHQQCGNLDGQHDCVCVEGRVRQCGGSQEGVKPLSQVRVMRMFRELYRRAVYMLFS